MKNYVWLILIFSFLATAYATKPASWSKGSKAKGIQKTLILPDPLPIQLPDEIMQNGYLYPNLFNSRFMIKYLESAEILKIFLIFYLPMVEF